MFSKSVARAVLALFWAGVIVIVMASAIAASYAWATHLAAERTVRLATLDRTLFKVATDVRVEIGTVGVSLITQADPEGLIRETLDRVDQFNVAAISDLKNSDLARRDDYVARIEEAGARLSAVEGAIIAEAAKPLGSRDIASVEPWRQAIYSFSHTVLAASSDIGSVLREIDPEFGELILIRELSYAVRDRYARQCSGFREAVQFDIPLTEAQREGWLTDIGAYQELWDQLDRTAALMVDLPWLKSAVAEGRAATASSQALMTDVLTHLSGSGQPAYDAADWSQNCIDAYPAILGIGFKSLDAAVARAEARKAQAFFNGSLATAALALALGFGLMAVRFVRQRLSLPLQMLQATVARLNRGDLATPVPESPWDDETGAIAKALETLRCQELETVRLRRRIDEMRDELVEHASQVSRAKSRFLATMSHEIRTPLNGILGTVQLLENSQLTSEQRCWIDTLSHSGQLLHDLVDDILNFSRIESGRSSVETVQFSLSERIAAVEASILPQATNKKLAYRSTIDPAVPDALVGDPAKLGQILLNLLGNAVKFTKEGEVSLTVDAVRAEDGEPLRVRFVIADTGIGIPPEARSRLFQPFTQADDSVARRFGGSGLGLAICRGYLDLLGGEIALTSSSESGTVFTVIVPFETAMGDKSESGAKDQSAGLPALDLLLADDNAVNAMIARTLLEQAGHRVTVVDNGRAAAKRACEEDFDVVLMDLSMPELDGVAATQLIRDCPHPTRSMVPVVAVTADLSARERIEQGDVAFDGFLGKPYKLSDLEAALAVAIGLAPYQPPPQQVDERFGVLVEQARDLGVDGARKVLNLYLSETPASLETLARTLATEDFEGVQAIAHRMKGAARHVGAEAIADMVVDVEMAAKERDLVALRIAVKTLTDSLGDALESFEKAARNELATLGDQMQST